MKVPGHGQYNLCAFCPSLCLDRCPVVNATANVTYSPQNKMAQGWALEHGQAEADEDLARTVSQCTGCLACHAACKYQVDVEQGLFSLRAALVAEGIAPYERARFEEDDALLQAAQAAAVPEEYFVEEAQAVLFPGCQALRQAPAVVTDTFRAFRALRIEFVGASPDAATCCGYPLYAGGYLEEFTLKARAVLSDLRRYRTVVVLSPCCLYTMQTLWAAAGVTDGPRLVLALDLIAPLLEREDHAGLGLRMAYHDNCFLGRHLGQYDLPRNVLTRVNGTPPLELRRARKDGPCCGAAGGWERIDPGHAADAARSVLEMASDAGAAVVASAASRCTAHLTGSRKGGCEVKDVMTLVADWAEQRGR